MKVLLDTSVWIHHFKNGEQEVVRLLEEQLVVSHEFVVAELACGSLKSREETLRYLTDLPSIPSISINELRSFIETRQLFSRGVGLVDVQLLGSLLVESGTALWTKDKRLHDVASELGVAYSAVSH